MSEFVIAERDGPLLILTFNRPDRANALHAPAHAEMAALLDDFEADPDLRVAIVTGAGERAFCAGNDLKFQADGGSMERPRSGFAGITKRSRRVKPIIAAVNGAAHGGGFEIILACDLAVAVATARFSLPEVRRGLVALAGMHLLPRQVPAKRAMAMLLAGEPISSAEALDWGLLNEVVTDEPVLTAARRWAARILESSPMAIEACKAIVSDSLATPDLAAALDRDYAALDRLRASSDFLEGPRAFSEKRAPQWRYEPESDDTENKSWRHGDHSPTKNLFRSKS